MKYTITYDANPKHDDIQVLYDGLKDHMVAQRNLQPINFFGFFIRDNEGNIFGGCCGCIMYGSLVVDTLWVSESLRGQGYGTKLMLMAERHASENRCGFMTVNTMDWEALDFYKKLGFYVEYERTGYDKNSVFYFLRKNLK